MNVDSVLKRFGQRRPVDRTLSESPPSERTARTRCPVLSSAWATNTLRWCSASGFFSNPATKTIVDEGYVVLVSMVRASGHPARKVQENTPEDCVEAFFCYLAYFGARLFPFEAGFARCGEL